MSAKPQPMAGQSDADDLIAELAKLMAQDARSEKPAEPTRPAAPIRIPGGDTPPPAQPKAEGNPFLAKPAAPVTRAPEEPFRFDFGLVTPEAPKAEPVARVAAPPPAPSSAPAPVATPTVPTAQTPDPSFARVDHDSIADLIAAELMNDGEPAPEPTPSPAPQGAVEHAPVAAAEQPAPFTLRPVAPEAPQTAQPRQEPRAPEPRPAAVPEVDRFKVAPVFGLGSPQAQQSVAPVVTPQVAPAVAARPERAEPAFAAEPAARTKPTAMDDTVGSDPIDEIESLIGSAMRVELAPAPAPVAAQKPAPSPALRSLATPTLPPAQPAQRSVSSADEAILAAAQAAGVDIGYVEAPETAEAKPRRQRRERAPRSRGMMRALAGPLVAVTLLLAAGFGLYWVLGLGGESGPAPLLTADASPVKQEPAVNAEAAEPQQSVVFNEIDGVVPGAEEQLVSRDQSDVNEVTQVPPAAEPSQEGLANRKVRTVTVRPDGTIVSGDDSVAGSNILPVDRPNVPELPGVDTSTPELLASTEPAAATPAAPAAEAGAASAVIPATDAPVDPAAAPAEPAAEPTVPPAAQVTPGATVPAVDATGNPIAGKTATIPLTRPTTFRAQAPSAPTSPVNAVVDTPVSGNMLPPPPATNTLGAAPAAPATPTQAAAAPAIPGAVEVDALPNNAPAYAQLASLRSEAEARQAAQNLVNRFGPLFGGANMEVQRVDLGERGVYYRVRVPAGSTQAAGNICTNVIAAGGDCVPM